MTIDKRWQNPQVLALHNAAVVRSKANWTVAEVLKALQDGRKGIKYARISNDRTTNLGSN